MAKNLQMSVLLDFYGELLTEKQAEALDLYYNQDLSLAEIADEMQVSRQGVRAFIKQGEAHLCEFEEKLSMAQRFSEISASLSKLEDTVDLIGSSSQKELLKKQIDDIKSRI